MPLTEKGKTILHAMEKPKSEGGYGPKKGESVFYASANKGTISGVHDVPGQPRTLKGLNDANRRLWQGANTIQAADQGNNWTPGERKVAVGRQAMLTPAIEANRVPPPYENLFAESAGEQAGDEEVSTSPVASQNNFTPPGGRMHDDEEDILMPEGTGKMGEGQCPHGYAQPRDQSVYRPAVGVPRAPTEGPGIPPPATMAGMRPSEDAEPKRYGSPKEVPEYKQAGKESIPEVNKANKDFWKKNALFNEGG